MSRTPKIAEAPRTKHGYYEARPGDIVGRNDLLVVDIREPDELMGELGHIHGVKLIPERTLVEQGLPDVPTDQPVVLVCQSGRRSAACALHLVQDRGFDEVYQLVGGMIRWHAEDRPVARTRTWR